MTTVEKKVWEHCQFFLDIKKKVTQRKITINIDFNHFVTEWILGILLKCLEGYYSYFCRSFEAQFAILNRLHRAILAHFLSFKTALLQQLNFQITINALTITIKTVLHALVTPFFSNRCFCHPLLCLLFSVFSPNDFSTYEVLQPKCI